MAARLTDHKGRRLTLDDFDALRDDADEEIIERERRAYARIDVPHHWMVGLEQPGLVACVAGEDGHDADRRSSRTSYSVPPLFRDLARPFAES